MSTTARRLIGREDELEAITRLLDARDALPGTVVLHGEAGIGKTSIWLAGLEAASAREYRVLSCRPSEAETRFSFAGITDLLADVVDDVLPDLPPVQRRSLEAALLLGDTEIRADERAVAAAFLATLRTLASPGPVCLAIDDLQWLDDASLAVVRFASARLQHLPVALLLAVRGDPPSWVRRLPEGQLVEIEVGGLSVGGTYELLRARLGVTFPRPTLLRLWETSEGSPFFALELAGALHRRGGVVEPSDPLPIPRTLDDLLRNRLDGLGEAALDVAHVVAASAEPTTDLVDAVLGPAGEPGTAGALDARILELDGTRLRFTHPLLGSAVAAQQTPARRRALHARLAEVVASSEERARHLALATTEPNDEIATILEEAAKSALARGAPAAAGELAEYALRLTRSTNVDGVRQRLLTAADMHRAAGDLARATELLDRARRQAAPGVERAAVLARLAATRPSLSDGVALYRQALDEAHGDDELEATIHFELADAMRFTDGVEHGIAHGKQAVLAAFRTDDLALRSRALAVNAGVRFDAGYGFSREEMDEAVALERRLPGGLLVDGPAAVLCHQLWWSGDLESARRLLYEYRDVRRARDDPRRESYALWHLAMTEWRAGTWDDAERYAADGLSLRTQLGGGFLMPSDELPAAVVAAHRGRSIEARDRARGALDRGKAQGVGPAQTGFLWVLGFLELSEGDGTAALTTLRRAYRDRESFFIREPGRRVELGDLLEALIAAGELDEAAEILALWEDRARSLDRGWALAILARGRGLLLAARGDLDGAFASFDRALAEHARSTDPFHEARTLLALGRTQRRAKRRGAARATLDDALSRFETLGAPLWAEQTRAELARIGGRTPSGDELTEAENRIAALVAEGRTNREVAAALFLTEHSVETALTRIYRKLGVRSRTELGRALSKS